MKFVYYPVPSTSGGSLGSAMPAAPTGGAWPKTVPTGQYVRPMTAATLALAILKDIDPAGAMPLLNPGGLWVVFSTMYPSTPVGANRMLAAHQQFASIPGNWLRTFSELLGAATSLAVAEQEEGYPFCLSMQFCKKGAASPHVAGTPAWPAAYTAAIQNDWYVDKAPTAPGTKPVADMPDYVIARQVLGGTFEFATLESKARNAPVDTGTYGNFGRFKQQADNAVIAAKSGAPAPPVLTRKILSLVAVRPQLKRPESRVLRCRWANHRSTDAGEKNNASDRAGLRFALASTAVHLHNAGFRELADALASCLVVGTNQEADERAARGLSGDASYYGLREYAGGWLGTRAGPPRLGDVVLPRGAFRMLRRLAKTVLTRDVVDERRTAYLLWRVTRWRMVRSTRILELENFKARVEMSALGLALLTEP